MVTEREKKEQAEKIASGMISAEGELLGIPVPKEALLAISPFLNKLVSVASEHGAKFIEQHLGGLLQSLNVSQAQPIAKYTGLAFAYALPFAGNIGQVVKTARQHNENYNEFIKSIAPVLEAHNKADGTNMFSINAMFCKCKPENAMIAHSTNILNEYSIGRCKQNVANLPNAILQTLLTTVKNNLADVRHGKNQDPNADKQVQIDKLTKTSNLLEDWGGAFVGMVTGFFGAGVKVNDPEKAIAASAMGSVSKIETYIKTNGLTTLSRPAERSELDELTKLVKETFERFQKEQNETAWSKPVLEKISALVASELIEGELAAPSLIYLIGDRKFNDLPEKYAHKKTMLAGDDEKEIKAELASWLKSHVQEIVQEETKIFSKGTLVDVDAFMKNVSYDLATIKDYDEYAIAFHPRSVLLAAGLSEEEITRFEPIQKQAMIELVQAGFEYVAAMPKDHLEEIGYDKKSIDLICDLAENPDKVSQMFESNRERTVGLVRNAIFSEKPEKWVDYLESRQKFSMTKDENGNVKTHLDKVKHSKSPEAVHTH